MTCLHASGKETSQLMNGTMQYIPRLLWLSNPQKQPRSFTETSFVFFLIEEEFISKTMNDSNKDLDKFPASKVRQLTKKMERSKEATRHIKQVASDPQMAQIHLMRHQHTDLPASKHKKRKPFVKPRPPSHKNDTSDRQSHCKKRFDAKNVYRNKERHQKCGDSNHIEGFQCPTKNFNANLVISMDTLQASVIRRNKLHSSQGNQRLICYKQELFMLVINQNVPTQKIVHPARSHSVYK